MSTANRLPTYLCRFYGNTDFALDTIANRHVVFIHVTKLNDPFDPYFFFETSFEDRYDLLLDHICKSHSADFSTFINRWPMSEWTDALAQIHSYLDTMRRSTFMFSTSSVIGDKHPRNNLHMWGHYGNGHRGIVIEFETAELRNCAKDANAAAKKKTQHIDQALFEVKYAKRISPLSPEDVFQFLMSSDPQSRGASAVDSYLRRTLDTKSLDWKG